jgi:hypothetical protein
LYEHPVPDVVGALRIRVWINASSRLACRLINRIGCGRLSGRVHSLITKDGSIVKKLLPQLQAYLPRPGGV